ncbi:MAG: FAD-dependent monooxygenase [Pseudomonadota bacterium]
MAYDFAPLPPPGPAPSDRVPVAIVGAGPVGLALAIDLAQRGVGTVVFDAKDRVSNGSRAICWAKRTLEIFDRLGIGDRMLAKGVTWTVGRLFHGEEEVYAFDLLPEAGHKYPAFVNLQQYYVEDYLIERAGAFPDLIDLRFRSSVTDHADHGDHVALKIEAPDGAYDLETDYLIACDGSASPIRKRMGLPFEGQTFDEHFLIADVEMTENPYASDAAERHFWFEPTFHPGESALLHKQPDDIWRIDLQLSPDADRQAEATEERVLPRLKKMLGDTPFRMDWLSVYRFRCARLERFVHNRVIFAGDSAHVVSPFGARGGNGGVQDADNLGWKLAAVLGGASPALLETYDEERGHAADENILNSSRATTFMTPKTPIERLLRAEVLRLSHDHAPARKLINSGRLSLPARYDGQRLQWGAGPLVGAALPDAPVDMVDGRRWLLEIVPKQTCLLILGAADVSAPPDLPVLKIKADGTPSVGTFIDTEGYMRARLGWDVAHLLRPDGHIAESLTQADIGPSLDRLRGRMEPVAAE